VKAFQFRLDPALRWRSTQLRLERESVSLAAGRVAGLQAGLIAKHNELRSGSSELAAAGSAAFGSWAAYVDRCRRQIRALEDQLREARKALVLQKQKMVEAHQKLRVLENLKRDDHADWARELGRETEAFAAEAFLAGLQRNRAHRDTSGRHSPISQ
jgi:hypothetical protein